MKLQPSRAAISLLVVAGVWLLGLAIAAHLNPLGFADSGVLNWMVAHRTGSATPIMTTLTEMFSPVWVGIWAIVTSAVLVLRDRTIARGFALMVTVAVAGAVCEMCKLAVNRPRPPRVDQVGTPEAAMSFPSGHVTGTAALAFGVAVVATVGSSRLRRVAAITVAVAIVILCAGTRLYVGAHWLSDVIAAAALAGAVALLVPVLTARGLEAITLHTPPQWHHVVAARPLISTKG